MPSTEDNSADRKGTLRASNEELQAGNVLFQTIREGTAKVESLKLLVDGFEIIEELGRGAFGVVYRARDEKLDRQVAIKISLLDDPRRREQYIKEAKNAAKLDCVGIVPVYQVGTLVGGQPFVVQRLIDGSTLREVVNESGSLDVHKTCMLMKDIALAVGKAHAVGMIHRDLKPDNILIDSAGRPWVADFGLAISEEEQGKHRGEKAGTPLYMSPEQLLGRSEWLDGRADIYALGIMLYEMLVGRTPFDAHTLAELEEQVLHREPKPISQRSPNIHSVMDTIFQNCCAKQVNDRYSNAHELVADLEYVLSELPLADTQVAGGNSALGARSTKRQLSTQLSVSTRRKTLRSTIRGQAASNDARRISKLLPWLGVLAILAIAGYFAWPRSGEVAAEKSDSRPPEEATTAGVAEAASESESTVAPPPVRPFRVSKGKEGTHTTIQAAVAMAEEGETITILPGNYVESLKLERNIKLMGEGNPNDIVIVGQTDSAISIAGGVEVELANMTFEGNASDSQKFNTIDIRGGSLKLKQCNVYSRTYDCVKVQANCELQADVCNFRSTAHPAINAQKARNVLVTNCSFDIKPQMLEEKSIPIGIQVIHSPGSVHNCTFNGTGEAVGIHWKNASGLITIANSTFSSCGTGVILQDCPQVLFSGEKLTSLIGCPNGILMQRCSGEIHGVKIWGSKGKTAIRIIDDGELATEPSVLLADCDIQGYNVSLSVEQAFASVDRFQSTASETAGVQLAGHSKLLMANSNLTQSELSGILIEDATAEFKNCVISENRYAGASVDANGMNATFIDCTFESNTSGLLVSAGNLSVRGGRIHSNSVGILVLSRAQLGQAAADDSLPSISLDVEQTPIRENENGGILIRTPCDYRLDKNSLSDPRNDDQPRIDGDLATAVSGDVTTVRLRSPVPESR